LVTPVAFPDIQHYIIVLDSRQAVSAQIKLMPVMVKASMQR